MLVVVGESKKVVVVLGNKGLVEDNVVVGGNQVVVVGGNQVVVASNKEHMTSVKVVKAVKVKVHSLESSIGEFGIPVGCCQIGFFQRK